MVNSNRNELELAYDAIIANDYEKAKYLLESLIGKDRSGYVELYLGVLYSLGKGVPVDRDRAFDLFAIAAKADIPSAISNFATLSERRGDTTAALRAYRKLAKKGDAAAMYMIYKLWRIHPNLASIRDEAVEFVLQSAALGNAYARRDVQRLELRGQLGPWKQIKAIAMFPVETVSIIFGIAARASDPEIRFMK